ncbi:MAG: MltR family transcriptional regulator [Rhodocyclaceae bacterium]
MKPVDFSHTDFQSLFDSFKSETDRGAAVLAGSYVENYLGIFLKEKMVDPSLADRLFASEGALSSFSQRIDLAQAFGFLSKVQCDDLHLIKKIRNHFAHHPKEASFDKQPVSDWVNNLIASKTKMRGPDGSLINVGDAKDRYLISAGMFVALNSKTT